MSLLLVGFHDPRHERVADDVGLVQVDDRQPFDVPEPMDRVGNDRRDRREVVAEFGIAREWNLGPGFARGLSRGWVISADDHPVEATGSNAGLDCPRHERSPVEGRPSSAHSFMAVYMVDGDPGAVWAEFDRRIAAGVMTMTDAVDLASLSFAAWAASEAERP